MAVLDFLFNGSAPPATTTYGSSTSTLPAWYNDYTQGLISKANAIAATPYQAYTGQRVAQNEQLPAVTGQIQGIQPQFQSNINPAIQTMQGMQGANAPSALTQFGGQPLNYLQQAGNINAMDIAQPNLNLAGAYTQAGGATPAYQGIQNYMNPYTNNVVNEIGRLGQENLSNALSGVTDKFIGGGQFGSSRMGRALGAQTRAGLRDIAGQQNQALQAGYTGALGASQADLQRQLQAGQQLGTLGSTQGSLANQQLGSLANLGQTMGTFGQADLQRQMDAAKGQGALAQTISDQAIKNAGALEAVGGSQAQQQQKALDTAYQDFLAQREYPQQMISFMNNAIRGLQMPQSQSTTQTGPASTYQASPLSQIAQAATGAAGLAKLFG